MYLRVEQLQLISFIRRQLLLASTFVWDMSVTYLGKENHLLSSLFYHFLPESKRKSRRMLYMQLQGMIMSPFNLKIEWDTTLLDDYGRTQFVRQYTNELNEWLDFLKAFEYETCPPNSRN